ncbi:MAG: glycosyltransferase family A protein, partial [Bacteroidetes bacterium]|nr:glycosyltransferase family A protein [Bacteroidota bacterium]
MLSLSILIPFYNSSDYLLRLLKSIYKAYSKDIIDYEIIVCIDSMFDTPLSISTLLNNSFNHEFISKIIIIKNKENLGVAKSRNELYFKSNKEYLIFIDQDDEIRNDFFLKVNSIYDKTRFDFLLNNALIVESQTGLKHKYYYQKPSLNIKDL